MNRKLLVVGLLFFLPQILSGQFFSGADIVTVKPFASQDAVQAGGEIHIALVVQVSPNYHINAHVPTEEFLVSTVVKFNATEGVGIGKINYPEPEMHSFAFSEKELAVYDNEFIINTKLSFSPNYKLGETELTGKIAYQGCDNQVCLAPAEVSFQLPIKVVSETEPIKMINPVIFSKISDMGKPLIDTTSPPSLTSLSAL